MGSEEVEDTVAQDQDALFGDLDEFTVAGQEWKGMPEFKHEDLTAWKSLIINFASQEDLSAFAKLIGQRLTPNTQSVWYPEAEIGHMVTKRYIRQPAEEF